MAKTNNLLIQSNPTLAVKEVQDVYVRQNFKNLQDYFSNENQLFGFKFFELQFTEAVTNYTFKHGLNIVPKDIIISRILGAGVASFNLGLFTTTNLNITTTGACSIRFFAGTYWKSSLDLATPSEDDVLVVMAAPTASGSSTSVYRAPILHKFTTVGTGRFVPTPGVLYIRFKIAGNGAGGNGSGTTQGPTGAANGGNVLLGTDFLVAYGGVRGDNSSGSGGAGGSGLINVGATGRVYTGGAGQGWAYTNVNTVGQHGGQGGSSFLGGNGGGGPVSGNGRAGIDGTGGGGGGAGASVTAFCTAGPGGGAGGGIEGIITTILSEGWQWTIPAAAAGGGAGASGFVGAPGGLGGIYLEECFQ